VVVLQYDETIIYSFVQFWDGVYNSFSCAYSGRREINSFAQFWGEVYLLRIIGSSRGKRY
jgi:hypothetical protein